jgi:hypothetical protein
MTTQQKRNVWYIAVAVAVLLLMVAEYFGVSALALLPILLVMAYVGFWAFDVK